MSESASQQAIEVSHLVKAYSGVTAVNDISFSVPRGEILGFLGPNGAGKSTTMRILTGYLPATSGRVSICGIPVASDPDGVKRRVGYMPENNPLPDEMRVSEYLYFRGRLKEIARSKLGSRIDEVLGLVGLADVARAAKKPLGGIELAASVGAASSAGGCALLGWHRKLIANKHDGSATQPRATGDREGDRRTGRPIGE